jgi:hypothetical protein
MRRLYQLEICAVLYASPTESCSSPVTSLCVSVYRRGAGGVGPHLHRAPNQRSSCTSCAAGVGLEHK